MEPSEILRANAYLMKLFKSGTISFHEAERRALVSGLFEELCSSNPWYAQQAKYDPDYWSKSSVAIINEFAGVFYRGRCIPSLQEARKLDGD